MARPKISEDQYRTSFQKMLADNGNDLSKLSPFMLQKAVGGRLENVNTVYADLFKAAVEQQELEKEAMPKPEWYVEEAKEAAQEVEKLILGKWRDLSQKLADHEKSVSDKFEQKEAFYETQIKMMDSHNTQANARIIELETVEEELIAQIEKYTQLANQLATITERLEGKDKRIEELSSFTESLQLQVNQLTLDNGKLTGQLSVLTDKAATKNKK